MSNRESFWAFSVRVYGKPGVPPACLALQNDYGLDVNMVLYCCWLGRHGAELDTEALERMLAFAKPWSEHVVQPLRHARTWMKSNGDAHGDLPSDAHAELRESIKAIELEAERLQQLVLENMTNLPAQRPIGGHDASGCVSSNLALYVNEAGHTPDADMRAYLAQIANASDA